MYAAFKISFMVVWFLTVNSVIINPHIITIKTITVLISVVFHKCSNLILDWKRWNQAGRLWSCCLKHGYVSRGSTN